MKIVAKYVSCGANRNYNCLDYGTGNLFVYASDCHILMADTEACRVTGLSSRVHNKPVTLVRWLRQCRDEKQLILSLGNDGRVVVWKVGQFEIEGLFPLEPLAIVDHSSMLSCGDAVTCYKESRSSIFVCAVALSIIHIHIVNSETGTLEKSTSLELPSKTYVMTTRLFHVPGAMFPIMVCGCHDSKIYILSSNADIEYQVSVALPGHEDWIMALDATLIGSEDMLLASGSKDSFIRLWRFTTLEENSNKDELHLKPVTFKLAGNDGAEKCLQVTLEAVLHGHEGLVSNLHWSSVPGELNNTPQLLSCSRTHDRSVIIWHQNDHDEMDGVWTEAVRLGEVGGAMEGYFGCRFGHSEEKVLAVNNQGGFHQWILTKSGWCSLPVLGGHFDQVSNLTWSRGGSYLLSVGKDQTTRLHAQWKRDNEQTWHEIARPQVHGYDMVCITALGRHQFASGADEKVVRLFTAPSGFIRNYGHICGVDVESDLAECVAGEGASVPSLGLSNKAVAVADGKTEVGSEGNKSFKLTPLTAPPSEDILMQQTLWPETAKLYGHGNEMMALASTSDGSILASACRATCETDAAILLWNAKSGEVFQSLSRHRLTVTQLAFSPDDKFLLSISRDRTWSLFRQENSGEGVSLYQILDWSKRKATLHSRIIWACGWLPDSSGFVTASRDKTVAVWTSESVGAEFNRTHVLNLNDEVTALAVDGVTIGSCVIIAIGLVNGNISLHKYDIAARQFLAPFTPITHSHLGTVKCLSFRPRLKSVEIVHTVTLASGGDDSCVYVYEIRES